MYWIDPDIPDASHTFCHCLSDMLDRYNPRKRPLIFLCIGTPLIPGDCLGPVTGSVLSGSFAGQTLSPMTIYGTLEMPVHALNVRHICRKIKKQHQKPFVIAIDAALGNTSQSGYILLKKGPLRPGKGVGKKLPPVGDLQITGIFQDIFALSASHQAAGFSRCISEGILEFYPSLQCPK